MGLLNLLGRIINIVINALKKAKSRFRCIVYRLYDFGKRIYGYRHGRQIANQIGVVFAYHDNMPDFDWDFNFDMKDILPEYDEPDSTRTIRHWVELHCEITICNRDNLKAFINDLISNVDEYKRLEAQGVAMNPPKHANPPKVEVSGRLTLDPIHPEVFGIPGNKDDLLEIHPVTGGRVIAPPYLR